MELRERARTSLSLGATVCHRSGTLVESELRGLPEERVVTQRQQQSVVDRDAHAVQDGLARKFSVLERASLADAIGERAARATLRSQIAHLEAELSSVLAERFPFIAAPVHESEPSTGPSLPGLAELERSRDMLAGRLQDLHRRVERRSEHERAAHELLEKMKLEPGRYKYYRVPVRDLGLGSCGVWEVRPRLGLIGMLAGWWQVKLSSGCPLPKGSRSTRDPAEPQ